MAQAASQEMLERLGLPPFQGTDRRKEGEPYPGLDRRRGGEPYPGLDRRKGGEPYPGPDRRKGGEMLVRLVVLLQLQRRVRKAQGAELPYIFVNETRVLVPYRQAIFWQAGLDGGWKVIAVSGLAAPDAGAPFVLWLNAACKAMRRLPQQSSITHFEAGDLPPEMGAAWGEWLPAMGLWLPICSRGAPAGVLALFRNERFPDSEIELLSHLSEEYGQSLLPSTPDRPFLNFRIRLKNWRLWLLGLFCAALLFPVRQSVLAPAEVTALQPAHIRASIDGVVKTFFVAPNQQVAAGDRLLRLEDNQLRTHLVVAQKNLEVARAELQQTQQLSLVDARSKVRLPMLQGRVEQLVAEVELVESQLARVVIFSPVDGVGIFDDPDIWLGRPISLGQKIMEVADPTQVRLEISLPMSEALPLAPGDEFLFFPNISPHAPVSGSLNFIGYQASETPEAGLAFTLRGLFAAGESAPRLGLRGTAKLYGKRAPLAALLLRRPFLQIRQWLGV